MIFGTLIGTALIITLITAAIFGIILLGILIVNKGFSGTIFESGKRRTGRLGEEFIAGVIQDVLREDDYLFTNVEIKNDGKRAEMDCIVVNTCGVFIFEVKNYSGQLSGTEEDFEWFKVKVTGAGNVYTDRVKNPIPQVKRQVHILAKYLRYYGCDVWVDGYAILVNNNSPVKSEVIISNSAQIDRIIHTHGKNQLSRSEVEKIRRLLPE